ncbi:hypothetical protein CUR178_06074 [Leishmania enriettii]|uniref:Uncharacterized protein n=1 Tax=Leishmania enriettii TaxID=5663 RepID=A0A836HSP1_LEIEN|nr:hypothetical protein CUR178_06074 [Leishmania enriettii]
MVRQLHNHAEEQRRVVVECRNRAEAMPASGVLRDGPAGKAGEPSPMRFVEVTSEKSMLQSFIPDGLLSALPSPSQMRWTCRSSSSGHSTEGAASPAAPLSTLSTTEAPRGGGSSDQRTSDLTARLAQSISSWWRGKAAPAAKRPYDTPKCALPEILDHNPYNYTVRGLRGPIADIDVGWRDYNAKAAMADDFDRPSRPGFLRRLLTGVQAYEAPRVELAVDYPAEWIDRYCTSRYASSAEFHQRITDAVHRHSALRHHQKLEIAPLALDFSLQEVMKAVAVISNYEIAQAFDRQFAPSATSPSVVCAEATNQADEDPKSRKAHGQIGNHGGGDEYSTVFCSEELTGLPAVTGKKSIAFSGSDAPAPSPLSSFVQLSDAQEELPATVLESIQAGQKLSIRDYHGALRVRDEVVHSNEEQFMDVDCFVTPLLSDPYTSGNIRSVRLTLPFQLAGNPILSVQMNPQPPVALVGELGRDAALVKDAF